MDSNLYRSSTSFTAPNPKKSNNVSSAICMLADTWPEIKRVWTARQPRLANTSNAS